MWGEFNMSFKENYPEIYEANSQSPYEIATEREAAINDEWKENVEQHTRSVQRIKEAIAKVLTVDKVRTETVHSLVDELLIELRL